MNLLRNNRQYLQRMLLYFLLSLLSLEAFVQLAVIKTPKVHVVPGFGMVPMDNSIGVWGVEGYGVTHYLLNGEIRTPYESGIQVVVLGDSYTEAAQVNDHEKYVSVTEQMLHDKGFNADLHNFGWSGRSIADYVYIARNIRDIYSPRVVVIQVGPVDFEEAFNPTRPNYFIVENGNAKLMHQDNYFHLNAQNIFRNSGLGSLFIYRFKGALDDLRFGASKPPSAALDNSAASQADSSTPNTREEQVLMGIEALKNAYPDSQIVFLIIPNLPAIENLSVSWSDENEDWLVDQMDPYTDSAVVYPVTGFQKLYDTKNVYPRGFGNTLPNYGHLNKFGHEAVARALAGSLENLLR